MKFVAYAALLPMIITGCAGSQTVSTPGLPAASRPASSLLRGSAKGNERLYIADFFGSMYELGLPDLSLQTQFTIPQCSLGIKIDKAGALYIPDNCHETISVFPKKQTTPSFVYTYSGIYDPQDVAIAKNGDVYVDSGCCNTGSQPTTLLAFHPNTNTPFKSIQFSGSAHGMAFDSDQNLYVATQPTDGADGDIIEFTAAHLTEKELYVKGLEYPSGLAIDKHGKIAVYDRLNQVIDIYAKNKRKVERTIVVGVNSNVLNSRGALAFSPDGSQIFVGAPTLYEVSEFDYATGTLIGTASNSYDWQPGGLAVGAPR